MGELDAFDFDTLADVKHLFIVCSTFGEGDPPDNAMKFTQWITSDDAPRLEGVEYSVCAMGDRSYTHFCKAGTRPRRPPRRAGRHPHGRLRECDVAYEDDFAGWKDAVFTSEPVVENAGEPAGGRRRRRRRPARRAGTRTIPSSPRCSNPAASTAEGSAKEVNHVEILLSGSGLEYEVGDALGVWPVNDP